MEEQSVDSLLGQAMYFGQSLGRVGFDFRYTVVQYILVLKGVECATECNNEWWFFFLRRLLLVPVFLEVMLERAISSLRQSLDNLSSYVDEETDGSSVGARIRGRKDPCDLTERSDDIVVSLRTDAATASSTTDEGGTSNVRLNFYFLVEACNGAIAVREKHVAMKVVRENICHCNESACR